MTRILVALGLICLMMGCTTTDNDTPETNENVNFNMISTNDSFHQTDSNQAKESISQYEAVTAVNAANTDKKMIIAFEIKHHRRFQLAKFNQDIQKKMDKEFPDLNVEVSTDKKLVLEISDLEEKIDKQDISNKNLEKEVDRLIELMKDKT